MTRDPGPAVARAARALVGTPFRLHGRDPRSGLDCIGLVAAALESAGLPADPPAGYGLRNTDPGDPDAIARRSALHPASGPPRPGDVVIVRPGPGQLHLLVCAGADGFIHAHAGLRRVVAMPGPLPWPVLGRWRPGGKD
ncbi:NlpC/P60 family protein [Pelagerythrobacter marinus]|uniref:NlpC/P60 family protein n=1 Tax=Pelagerythrobacter marinus TaxID=538382 RepID=UPI002036BE20|nr:NlpC/P60 family protein [Pelagerythrobacter marinus]USA39027.1 C40 family peptidase [Pelagerythrobacter marinus]WPZ06888.1 NlpC/P60 family protein [Pelagerythrobacter marinus]